MDIDTKSSSGRLSDCESIVVSPVFIPGLPASGFFCVQCLDLYHQYQLHRTCNAAAVDAGSSIRKVDVAISTGSEHKMSKVLPSSDRMSKA